MRECIAHVQPREELAPAARLEIVTTLGQLAGAAEALNRLLEKTMAGTRAVAIARLSRLAAPEVELFHQQRMALVKELGAERDPTLEEVANGATGKVFAVTAEHVPEFSARLQAIAALEVRLATAPIVLDLDEIQIRPADLNALGPLLSSPP